MMNIFRLTSLRTRLSTSWVRPFNSTTTRSCRGSIRGLNTNPHQKPITPTTPTKKGLKPSSDDILPGSNLDGSVGKRDWSKLGYQPEKLLYERKFDTLVLGLIYFWALSLPAAGVFLASSIYNYWTEPDPDKPGNYRLVSKWKRLSAAIGLGGVIGAFVLWISQFPRRTIKKIGIHYPLDYVPPRRIHLGPTDTLPAPPPPESLLKLYPVLYPGARIGISKLSDVKLVKPLSESYQAYHSRQFPKTDKVWDKQVWRIWKPLKVEGKFGKYFLIDGRDATTTGSDFYGMGIAKWEMDKRSLELALLGYRPKKEGK